MRARGYHIGAILVDRLPTKVERLLTEIPRLRSRWQGYSLGDLPLRRPEDVDVRLAAWLLALGCSVEETAAAVWHRHRLLGTPRRSPLCSLEYAIETATRAAELVRGRESDAA
jgi:hypothetical protein